MFLEDRTKPFLVFFTQPGGEIAHMKMSILPQVGAIDLNRPRLLVSRTVRAARANRPTFTIPLAHVRILPAGCRNSGLYRDRSLDRNSPELSASLTRAFPAFRLRRQSMWKVAWR